MKKGLGLVESLGGKKVIGASAGGPHTAVWTDAGEIFTFGCGYLGQLGHGGEEEEENEDVPRLLLVDELAFEEGEPAV